MANHIICETDSPYASPILLVKKKNGEYRMCVDYRALNAKTIKCKYPMPRIDDHLDKLKGANLFVSLDLSAGYHQIPIAEESVAKTALVTPDGHYAYVRMPFGLVCAPAVFQRMINTVLGSLRYTTALAYMDDILVPSNTIEEGFVSLRKVLETFRQAGLTLRLAKCYFFRTSIEFLGYEISGDGIRPGVTKTEAVRNFPEPRNVHEVRQFLGLASYFRKFVKNFAEIARNLTLLTKKNVQFQWQKEQIEAFKTLKLKLTERPVLAIYDPKASTELHTDASKVGIAGILLQQQQDGTLKPVLYFSHQTSKKKQRYHS